MKVFRIEDFIGGWFVGDFDPTIIKTKEFEVSIKHYKKGDCEKSHVHHIAEEVTVIISGLVEMNGKQYKSGDIVLIGRGEYTDFKVIEDTITAVVKTPSVIGDKYVKADIS